MSSTSGGSTYGARLSGIVIALGFLSAAVLYLLILSRPGSPSGDLFGEPFPAPRTSVGAAADSTRSAEHGGSAGSSLARPVDSSPVPSAPGEQQSAASLPDTGSARASSIRGPQPVDARELARRAVAARDWARAIEGYDRLIAEHPADRGLAIERARAISWSGAYAAAAAALRVVAPSPEHEPEIVLDLVRNLLWAERFAEADDVLESLASLRGDDAEVNTLRTEIRQAHDPSVELATLWLERRDSPEDRLTLARALAREGRLAESLDHYRRAQRAASPADSLALEIAAVAAASDSLGLAASTLAAYVQAVPHDSTVRLRLARVYHLSGRTSDARREYLSVITSSSRYDARFELAQLEAWSGHPDRARVILEALLRESAGDAAVLLLLGDLARWDGELDVAAAQYRAATESEPGHPGLAESMAELERAIAARPPLAGVVRWAATVDGFNDRDGFSWLSTRATRSWHNGAARLDLAVHQDLWDADVPPSETPARPGHGIELAGETPLTDAASVRAGAGVRSYGSGFDFVSWLLELSHPDVFGAAVMVGHRREPAFRRAATAAALQAQVASDVTRVTVGRSLGGWHAWSQVEVEHLSSTLGGTWRRSGSAALRRELGRGWAAYGSAGTLTTDGPSPVLSGWGPLYWSPSSFTTVAAGGEFSAVITPAWAIRMRLAPGYAWIDERTAGERRYVSDRAATLSSGFEAAYLRGQWRAVIGGDSDAAHRGYRAASLRLGIHYSPSRP